MKKDLELLKERGLTEVHHFERAGPSLEEAQEIVGGPVEVVPTPPDKMNIQIDGRQMMLVNENGMSLDLPYNRLGSYIAGIHLLGNVIILTGDAAWQ